MRLKVKDFGQKLQVARQLVRMGYSYNGCWEEMNAGMGTCSDYLYLFKSLRTFSGDYTDGGKRVSVMEDCIPVEFLSEINKNERSEK